MATGSNGREYAWELCVKRRSEAPQSLSSSAGREGNLVNLVNFLQDGWRRSSLHFSLGVRQSVGKWLTIFTRFTPDTYTAARPCDRDPRWRRCALVPVPGNGPTLRPALRARLATAPRDATSELGHHASGC